MTFDQEAAIRSWLASIGETDPALIADTMNLANRDAVARGYLLERAESARETSRDCRDCTRYRRPGKAEGYCCRGDLGLPLAYGDHHPLRQLPADHGADCAAFVGADSGAVRLTR
ncbi:hypothetical protein AGMMS49960_02750 [Betaproteobacteria bacterium]|nr:hypothetical protein AGMMS49543_28440 [Betaproteobacteria bacterium]GHT98851.1 hypothetical protein AGMMS49960_02750 [Betaproteobacteria bacterium]GHU11969.1 hypothetical protein AGMMS50225_18720 [Betaproteobacteria bacterium]GHU21058.1 hypothetical protein AGMMS50243_17780 [Betaproteobacteria bacterium]